MTSAVDNSQRHALRNKEEGIPPEGDISMVLEKLYGEKGWDFRNYKRSSLTRRVGKRLNAHNIESYRDYCSILESDPAEYKKLFSNITIKVSEFFREPEVFEALRKATDDLSPSADGLRVWSCASAHGEEAYSLAILLMERLGAAALKNIRVFATDIDIDALDFARRAEYREEALRNVDPAMRDRYFFMKDGLFKVKYNIRNMVRFGHLDIVRGSSISKIDILSCRNLFIYFNKALQEEVFRKIDYAVKPGGILLLGKAEVVPSSFAPGYEQLAPKMGIYRKRA